MSLLIKALEQAAKDRKAGRVEPVETTPAPGAQAPGASVEPTLEPAPPPRGGAAARAVNRTSPDSASSPAEPRRPGSSATGAAASSHGASLATDTPAAQRRSATSLAGLAQIDAQQQRARAATVMQAGGGPVANVIAFFRGSPVMVIAALAVLCGIVFGIYVYLQISKPGIFVRQAATRPNDAPPPAPPPPPAAQPVPSGLPGTAAPEGPAVAGAPGPAPGPGVSISPGAPASGTIMAPAVTAPGPLSSASVIASAAPMDLQRQPVAERPAEARPERGSARAERQAEARVEARTAAPPAEPPVAAGRERISVSASSAQPRLNPLLTQAYSQLQSGNVEEARTLYTRVNQAEPLNIDALLGLAYIAAQENRSEDAMKQYLRILQLNPRHAVTQGALIGLMGRADTAASESRLKQLIAREPSPFLHFVLGNLYADQSQWTQAQQAYFQAHHLEPDNPDYAYNLAVGLDHLRQSKLALNFYRRAEQLASAQGRSNFNLSHARERIRALSSPLE
jgi:Tfp pilus assembly protein PilF